MCSALEMLHVEICEFVGGANINLLDQWVPHE